MSPEDLAYDVLVAPRDFYGLYLMKTLDALAPKKSLLGERQFNPHEDLDPFFTYLKEQQDFYMQRIRNNEKRGSLDKLSRLDVLAMYGRVKQIYDRTSGIIPTIFFWERFFSEAASMRKILPDSEDIVDYIQEHGPLSVFDS